MDDLEFRRRVFAEPSAKDPQLLQAAADDPARQAFMTEIRQFDQKLTDALKVDVPENLAQRLILEQTLASHRQTRNHSKVYLALAASITFALGLTIQMLYPPAVIHDLGQHSLAHIGHELTHLNQANGSNSVNQVNAKLARFGGKLSQSMGQAVFANYCNFNGMLSLHLIYEAPQGRISVFVIPADNNLAFVEDFADNHFVGKGLDFNKAFVSIVGSDKKAVNAFSQQFKQNASWST